MEEFLTKATEVNRELANKSENERIQRKELQPKLTFKAITELVNKTTASGEDTTPQKSQTRNVQRQLFVVQDELSPVPNGLDDSQASDDDSVCAAVHPDPENTTDETGQLYFVKTYKDKPPERVLPCYQHFDGNCTAGASCVYSHDHDVLTAYGREQLKKLVRTKYVTAEDIAQAAKEKTQNNPRHVTMQPTQDARRLPSGRGPGNLRILSRPAITPQPEETPAEQG